MRIIAGRLGGRGFASPHGHRTHPMSQKARGALFNTLGDISDLAVLDAFAGSGALSFEAISRGAAHVTAIDRDRHAQTTIAANARALNLQKQLKLIKASAQAWLGTADQTFDIVILDPPFEDLQPKLLGELAARTKPAGITVFSLPLGQAIEPGPQYEKLAAKDYGDSQLIFYRRN